MGPCALSYASDSGDARICQRGAKRGSEATERGEGTQVWEGDTPSHGRDIMKFRVSKWPFFYSPFSFSKLANVKI